MLCGWQGNRRGLVSHWFASQYIIIHQLKAFDLFLKWTHLQYGQSGTMVPFTFIFVIAQSCLSKMYAV